MKKIITIIIITIMLLSSVSAFSLKDFLNENQGELGDAITGKLFNKITGYAARSCSDTDSGKDKDTIGSVTYITKIGKSTTKEDICAPYRRRKSAFGWSSWELIGNKEGETYCYTTDHASSNLEKEGQGRDVILSGIGKEERKRGQPKYLNRQYKCMIREQSCTSSNKPTETKLKCIYGCVQNEDGARCISEQELESLKTTGTIPTSTKKPATTIPTTPELSGTTPTTIKGCEENDGGKNEFISGWVKKGAQYFDYCEQTHKLPAGVKGIVNEVYCDSNGNVKEEKITCPNVCENRACKRTTPEAPTTPTPTTTCSDTDKTNIYPDGINYAEQGTITSNGKLITDTCFIGMSNKNTESCEYGQYCYLKEFACKPTETGEQWFNLYRCPNGCYQGRCLKAGEKIPTSELPIPRTERPATPSTICQDSDNGIDFENFGAVTYKGKEYPDKCIKKSRLFRSSITYLYERYCNEAGKVKSKRTTCKYGCKAGKCNPAPVREEPKSPATPETKEPPRCTQDTDSGRNINVKGQTIDQYNNIMNEDYCSDIIPNSNPLRYGKVNSCNSRTCKLKEYVCSKGRSTAISMNCPGICSDGKCLKEAERI